MKILLVGALLALSLAAAPALGAERPPRIGEVDYFKEKGAQGPDTELLVFGKRIEAMRLRAAYAGAHTIATATEFEHVDTNRWGHPWIPNVSGGGGRALLYAVKHSFADTGVARLTVIAKNDGGTTKEKVRIVDSECDHEPPIYPFTCVVEL